MCQQRTTFKFKPSAVVISTVLFEESLLKSNDFMNNPKIYQKRGGGYGGREGTLERKKNEEKYVQF